MRRNRLGFLAGLALIAALRPAGAAPLIDFPTENRALLGGRPQDFFMYVDRDFEGEKSKPWQGGQFGFVRGPVREKGRISYIQLHEGVDIAPVRRDAQGIPLDPVRAAAAGRVVHVTRPSRHIASTTSNASRGLSGALRGDVSSGYTTSSLCSGFPS